MNKDELINSLMEEIEDKNREINNLHHRYNKIVNSRTWRYATYGQKLYRCLKSPGIVLRKFGLKKRPNDISNFRTYNSYYQENENYSSYKTDIKAIAFYLPQFHSFKENDEWWGKGFTEWTNTKKSTPRYLNHYQPREPHDDIGYYDLSNIEVLKSQIELAKQHGIYGFCFYYYWFSGKRLMEKPVDMLLEHQEIDFPFCLCWANENWTRAWDGQDKEVLISQDYSDKDPEIFIRDIKKYIIDKRYIRIDNKPVIMIYNPHEIPKIDTIIMKWRREAEKQGIGEIYIITRNLIVDNQKPIINCDAEFDFAPAKKAFASAELSGHKGGNIYDYEGTVREMINIYHAHKPRRTFFYSSTMAWDNSARRQTGYNIYNRFSLEGFYNWNREIIRKTRQLNPEDKRFMFINAWNEWCEGTYLEPDKKYGYANINTLSKAIFDIPYNQTIISNKNDKLFKLKDKRIAVQVHLFHTELVDEIVEQLNNIPYNYDCFISTDTEEKKKIIEDVFYKKSNAENVYVDVTKNQGRDVGPFLVQISKVYQNYDYICHIHSKKSKTVEYGDDWRTYLYDNLFGSKENVSKIFETFENDERVGVIYPNIFPVISDQTSEYGVNRDNCLREFKRLGIPEYYINERLEFPAGTMFWAKMEAIKPLFEVKYRYSHFAKEKGQLDSTPAHAIERIFCTLANSRGYIYKNIYNNSIEYKPLKKKRLALFAHYNEDGKLLPNDINYVNELKKYTDKIIFISNQQVIDKNKDVLEKLVDKYYINEDEYDFGSWRVALENINEKEIEKYEEIVFANDSRILSGLSFDEIFSKNLKKSIQTLVYHNEDGNYIGSDFMIIPTDVLLKKKVYNLFTTKKETYSIEDKKETYNKELTDLLNKEKVKIEVFVNETKYINKYLIRGSIDKKGPFLMLLLRTPLLNKASMENIIFYEKHIINDFIKRLK